MGRGSQSFPQKRVQLLIEPEPPDLRSSIEQLQVWFNFPIVSKHISYSLLRGFCCLQNTTQKLPSNSIQFTSDRDPLPAFCLRQREPRRQKAMCSFITTSILAKNRSASFVALTRNTGRVKSLCGMVQPPSIVMRADRSIPEKINIAGFDICGVSVAAIETCLWIPSLSLAFDSGRCPRGVVGMRYMAVTHGHCDHIHGLPLHLATRTLQQLPTPRYFLPPAIEDDVRDLVTAVGRLEHCSLEMQAVPLRPGVDEVELKKGWVIRSVQTKHTVPSQGYVIFRKRKKLRKEFLGMSGSELVALKRKDVIIEDVIQTPEIAYTGDTQLEAIRESEDFQKARILITEMTFIDEACTPSEAALFGHIHLREVMEKSDLFLRNEAVVFTHFSARYSKEQILEALKMLPPELRQKSVAFGIGG